MTIISGLYIRGDRNESVLCAFGKEMLPNWPEMCQGLSPDRFAAIGQVDNRTELCVQLGISVVECSQFSNEQIIERAYAKWGRKCLTHIHGNWVLATWDPSEQQLFLARSRYGTLPLYYINNGDSFIFASNRRTLQYSKFARLKLDELWLAQYLISWPAYHGERTPYNPIKCLPPGHWLVVDKFGSTCQSYWNPIDSVEVEYSRRYSYIERFLELFDEAVNSHLQGDRLIAATLSGGLDSGAVTATAARLLATRGKRLTAYTSVPHYDTGRYVADRFGDETPFALATAEFAENIDLKTLVYPSTSPVIAIREALQLTGIPCHGAGNLYWLLNIQRTVKEAGFQALLTGAAGNAGVSWTGDLASQSWSFLLAHYSGSDLRRVMASLAKERLKTYLPTSLLTLLRKRCMEKRNWCRGTAIHPNFARKLNLLERRLDDPYEHPPSTPREQRARILLLGRTVIGGYISELGSGNGLNICDPTADARLLEYVLAVPDHIFMDPETGIDRWLIREAMKGRLPDQVRLNRSRGLQAADMVPRLRASVRDVEEALGELAAGPAAEFVDVEYMRQVWRIVQTEDSPRANVFSKQILLRGIMAGLFVNGFHSSH